MIKIVNVAVIILCVVILGSCLTPQKSSLALAPGKSVTLHAIRAGNKHIISRAAVVGPNSVLSAHHCIKDASQIWIEYDGDMFVARLAVVYIDPKPEPIVLLSIGVADHPVFSKDDIYNIRTCYPGRYVNGPNGLQKLERGLIVKGYSGSPIVDIHGNLTGVVFGYDGRGNPIVLRIPSELASH